MGRVKINFDIFFIELILMEAGRFTPPPCVKVYSVTAASPILAVKFIVTEPPFLFVRI